MLLRRAEPPRIPARSPLLLRGDFLFFYYRL
jgi:hypothetical protein